MHFIKHSKNFLEIPIPLNAGQVQDWKTIPLHDVGVRDPLVPLGMLSHEAGTLVTSAVYYGEHHNSPYAKPETALAGSLLTLFARRSTAQRLLAAERLLPAGHHLLIFDAYRPLQVQESLYNAYLRQLREKHPDMTPSQLELETQKYVSRPSHNPAHPAPHNTGGTIDLAIIVLDAAYEKEVRDLRDELANNTTYVAKRIGLEMRLSAIMRQHAHMLDFGTAFDHGGAKSALTYYEAKIAAGETLTKAELKACKHRRLLFQVMTQAGFQPYFAEWWHFNAPETQMGAAAAGLGAASFGAIGLDESNKAHETMRGTLRQEMLKAYGAEDIAPHTALEAEILTVIRETGDPGAVTGWPVEAITAALAPQGAN